VGELHGKSSEGDVGSQVVLCAVGNKSEMMVSLGWVFGDLNECSTERQVEAMQSQQRAKQQVERVSASGSVPPDRDGRGSREFCRWPQSAASEVLEGFFYSNFKF